MSNCTFLLIEKNKVKLVSLHYGYIKDIIEGQLKFEDLKDFDLEYSDTKEVPSFVINFDKKTIKETNYNCFTNKECLEKYDKIDFEKIEWKWVKKGE